ncbi:nucleoside 2-deoxyribosyltransferase domain-containing protein [Cereibacter sphaeroides]|uniref:nucleoside 2-deoxyribosyltransferase domain-containing protein n=1 Tax=Cereibacter sphaeroides TaxID=1063 RepID=UPI001F3B2481|nr:nucleoside 2-deoxyribosyltransferase domain-containing protein [Cereibacter sphaeroides]MCE6959587.1 nucleoside 2-deoxyribosyltransferase domain-containing protein [Cereibacter sphaeroides]MCE6974553.1 nucleoside 2-deoxyribosyltransferase domain-containing protein [Cereibacter sphaeroides]
MRIFTPPVPALDLPARRTLFLAGSIDMWRAGDWQADIARALQDLDVVIYNPRRSSWDSSWVQDISNPHHFGKTTRFGRTFHGN